jgi:hypothetical protein
VEFLNISTKTKLNFAKKVTYEKISENSMAIKMARKDLEEEVYFFINKFVINFNCKLEKADRADTVRYCKGYDRH